MIAKPSPGDVLCGKYELVRLCGQGGSSRVYEARHMGINRPVAIKVLPRSETGEILVHREALAGAINSRHVVQIADIAEDVEHDVRLVVMELLQGASLSAILSEQRRLEEAEVVTVLRHVLAGLERAHERGIVHGDLKPGNLYCDRTDESERVVILDFGIAHTTASPLGTRALGGTPLWMSPDAVYGRNLRWTADTWPLGLMAFYMLVGEPFLAVRSIPDLVDALAPMLIDNHRANVSARATALGLQPPAWLDPFFRATVSLHETDLLPIAELRQLLPELPERVPRLRESHEGRAASSEKPRLVAAPARETAPTPSAGLAAVLETLQHQATLLQMPSAPAPSLPPPPPPGEGAFGPPPPAFGNREQWQLTSLTSVLSESMREHVPEISAFVTACFGDFEVNEKIIRLRGAKIRFAKSYDFFLTALDAPRTRKAIQTVTFLGYTKPLESLLKALDPDALKVIIVLVDTPELGLGVRARIAELFRNYKAALVPAYVGDIVQLRGEDAARQWLQQHWQENRPVNNPFELRVHDRTVLIPIQSAVVNRVVHEVLSGVPCLGIYGAPGSGKSTLLRRVQDELELVANFYWISLRGLVPGAFAKEFLHRAAESFRVPFRVVDDKPVDAFTSGLSEALAAARRTEGRVVVVIDDADALSDPTFCAGNEADRQFLDELRQQIAHHAVGGDLSFVFVGMRTFRLASEEVGGRSNPLRRGAVLVPVPPLGRTEMVDICNLGRQVDLAFDDDAIARIEHWSAGNVFVIQMLCGKVLELACQGEASVIHRDFIDRAANELVAARQSFERRLMPSLTAAEKLVLSAVPRVHFRSPLELAAVLPSMKEDEVGNSLDSLVEIGVLARPDGQTRVHGRLLESWVQMHMGVPEIAETKKREKHLRWAALGMVASALLYAAGTRFLGAGEQTIELAGEAKVCTTAAILPKRAIPAEPTPIRVIRNCAKPTAGRVGLEASGTTYALFEANGSKAHEWHVDVSAASARTQAKVDMIELDANQSEYGLLLTADGAQASIVVGRNWLGEMPSLVRGIIVAAGALPALLGLLLAFYGDVRKMLGSLFAK